MSLMGILVLYPLHGVAIVELCHSRFDKMKTAMVCGGIALLQIVLVMTIHQFFTEPLWIYIAFWSTLVIFLMEVFWISSESVSKTIFVIQAYLQAFCALIFLSGMLSKWLFGGTQAVTASIRTVLHSLGLAVYGIWFRKKFEAIRNDVATGWWPVCFLSILYTIYISYIAITAQAGYFGHNDMFKFLLLMVTMAAGYAVIFHLIRYMREAALKSQMEQYQRVLLEKLEIMEKAEEDAKRLRHDFKHHIQNITQYARNREIEELLEYLGEYSDEVEHMAQPRLCENLVVDHILTIYADKAREKGITVDFVVSVDTDIDISNMDLVAILANLMENAIYGCLDSGKEQTDIKVCLRTKAGKFSIQVENTCQDKIAFENGRPKLKNREGIGISSILNSVEKYEGDADFRSEGGRFFSRIILKQHSKSYPKNYNSFHSR